MSIVILIAPTAATATVAWATLRQADLADAAPSRREQLTPQQVQQLMLKTVQQRRGAALAPASTAAHAPSSTNTQTHTLDKIWTELAADLLLGNVDHAQFGWCQTLDDHTPAFWQRFDPETRFVLVYEEPTAYAARVIALDHAQAHDLPGTLQHWHTQHNQLINTFYALGANAMLVHASQMQSATLDLGLIASACTPQAMAHALPDAQVLTQLLQPIVAANVQMQTLWQELQAASQVPWQETVPPLQAAHQALVQCLEQQRAFATIQQQCLQLEQAQQRLQSELATQSHAHQSEEAAWRDAQSKYDVCQQQLAQQSQKLKAEQEEGVLLLTQLHQVQEELESHFLRLQEETKAKAAAQQELQALQQAQEQHKQQLQQAQEEGELLLTQLHQVQEELESHFLRLQEETKAKAAAQQELQALQQAQEQHKQQLQQAQEEGELLLTQLHQVQEELESHFLRLQEETKAKAAAQQELKALQQAQEQHKQQLQQAQEEGELLLTQLHQVQEELESHFFKRQEESNAKAELQVQLTAATQAQKAESAAKAAAQQQLQTLHKAQEQNKSQLLEAQEEGELLLTQLHEVQEELEQYFIKYQEQRQQYQAVAEFWCQHTPAELWVDMRRTPDGAGWYEPEADGRWSGPTTDSTVGMPPLAAGDYLLELHIADAMAPELVAGLQLSAVLADGETVPVELVHEFGPAESLYPMASAGVLSLPATHGGWQLRLALPEVISPDAHGGNDSRHLGLRLQGLRLSHHTKAAQDAEAQA